MSYASSRLEITERVIDFGSHVVQLSQVTSVRVRRSSVLGIIVGSLLLIAGVGLLGLAIYALIDAFLLDGILNLISLFGLIPGAILALLGRHLVFGMRSAVVVAASDGAKIAIPARREELLVSVFERIKQALSTSGPHLIRVDLAKGSVETLTPNAPLGDAEMIPGGAISSGLDTQVDPAAAQAHQGHMPHGGDTTPSRQAQPASNGAIITPHDQGAGINGGHGRAGAGQNGHMGGANGRDSVPASQPVAMPAQAAEPVTANLRPEARTIGQIDDLLVLMDDAKVPYQDDLERMLMQVRSHFVGDGVSRDDALANWHAFSEYARDYLSGVEGLIPLIDQVQSSPLMRQG